MFFQCGVNVVCGGVSKQCAVRYIEQRQHTLSATKVATASSYTHAIAHAHTFRHVANGVEDGRSRRLVLHTHALNQIDKLLDNIRPAAERHLDNGNRGYDLPPGARCPNRGGAPQK